ncbi:MAG: hypothetical protein WB778_08065 [Thermoplasmata archaeon]
MIRVRVQETRLFTNLGPTEVAIVAAQLEHQLNDHFDPKELRARRKWRETVDVEAGSGALRYFCNCKLKDEQEGDCIVHVTGITKTQGRRSGAKPAW